MWFPSQCCQPKSLWLPWQLQCKQKASIKTIETCHMLSNPVFIPGGNGGVANPRFCRIVADFWDDGVRAVSPPPASCFEAVRPMTSTSLAQAKLARNAYCTVWKGLEGSTFTSEHLTIGKSSSQCHGRSESPTTSAAIDCYWMCFWDLFSQCHRLFAGIPSLISPVRAPNIKAYSNACMYVYIYIYIGIISCIYRYDIIIYQMLQYQMVRPASAFNEAQRQRIAKVRMTA